MARIDDDRIQLRNGDSLPISSLEYSTSRSGGPGGQNVNKVETKVEIKMQVTGSPWLSEGIQRILEVKLTTKIDREGWLHVTSSTERTQLGNRNAALDRLLLMLDRALTPEKKRVPTKATRSSKKRRVDEKKRDSNKKQSRRWRGDD